MAWTLDEPSPVRFLDDATGPWLAADINAPEHVLDGLPSANGSPSMTQTSGSLYNSTAWNAKDGDSDDLMLDERDTGFHAYLYNTARLRTGTDKANADDGGSIHEPYDDIDSYESRPLTKKETDHARSLYPGIDPDKIRIIEGEHHPMMNSYEAIALEPEENGVVSIYTGSNVSSDNFIEEYADSEAQMTFNHELYHAAQYQGVVSAHEDFTKRDLWSPYTEYNEWYDDAIVHPDIGREETTVEESAVIVETALRAKETGEDVGDLLEEQGFTVWGPVDTDYLVETFTGQE